MNVFFLGNSPLENRLYSLFADSFSKFSREWWNKNPRTAHNIFRDNDSTMTGKFGEDDMKRAWHSHLRSLGMRTTYRVNPEGDNVYVADPAITCGLFIKINRVEASKILALGYVPTRGIKS